MEERFKVPEGLVYVPRFIRQETDLDYGDVVTHEEYNELMRLNMEQGDYNTEVLRTMAVEQDPTKAYHIGYLDALINQEVSRLDSELAEKQALFEENTRIVNETRKDMDGFNQEIQNIINGVTHVHQSEYANNLTGAATAGVHKYYGTNYDGVVGYHDVPDNLSARDMSLNDALIQGIYFKPRPESVEEYMLTDAVRHKLNREAISDYEYLDNIPMINSVELKGNISLGALGIQPAGNYLTDLPGDLAHYSDITAAIAPYLLASTASSTYATKTELNNKASELSTSITNNYNAIVRTYNRVAINTEPSNPINGDIKVVI